MEPRISFITLGVRNLAAATAFYENVLGLPRLKTPPEIVFFEMGHTWLALYGRSALARDADMPPDAALPGSFPGFTLAHNVASEQAVDALLADIKAKGGRIVKPAKRADWGGYSGYFADPDGFLWEVAYNPDFPHV
jgi:catechol 2,3-dioxygenase-like lactoylglutathione lyase family enzyme